MTCPNSGALALDDADTVASEPLLLHLLNTARDRGLRVLLSGHAAPSRWPVRLPDLSSRLRAITAVEIRPPSDDLLAALLVRLLSDRQLSVAQSVQDWLLTRLPRSPAVLAASGGTAGPGQPDVRQGNHPFAGCDDTGCRRDFVADADEVSISGVDPSSRAPGFL